MRKGTRDGSLNIHIRTAEKDDLDALLNLEKLCYKEETFHREQIKYLLLKAKSVFIMAESQGEIIGSMIILLRNHIGNGRIYSLNVHPGYRRMGIGGSLMDYALFLLKEKGYKNITLEVGVNNIAAQKLYSSKDFKDDKLLDNYYKNGDDALHMIRKL